MKVDKFSGFNAFMSKQRNWVIVSFLLFIPLLFIGTRTSHDWGDDFAQYIQQTANIVKGLPQTESTFIYKSESSLGPPAYTIGFPLILAPVYAIAGNSISTFIMYVSFFYMLLGLLLIVFYRQYYRLWIAFVLALLFIYNPQMLVFKREVMSDIPFTALLVLSFIFYSKIIQGKTKIALAFGLLVGFLLILRPTGFVFLLAIGIDQVLRMRKGKSYNSQFFLLLMKILLIPVLIYILFNSILFPVPSAGSFTHYISMILSGGFMHIMADNFTINLLTLRYMYEPESGVLKGFSLIMGSFMLSFLVLGFVKRLFNKPGVMEWFFIIYIIMLLVFPYQNSWFRLMVPIGFIFLFYVAEGLKLINLEMFTKKQRLLRVTAVAIFILYIPGIIQVIKSGNQVLEGPQKKESAEVFDYIKRNVAVTDVIVFAKPRALALYTGCRSLCDPFTTDPTKLHTEINTAGADYILIHKMLTSEKMHRYVQVMMNRLTVVYTNNDFTLYRINPEKHR